MSQARINPALAAMATVMAIGGRFFSDSPVPIPHENRRRNRKLPWYTTLGSKDHFTNTKRSQFNAFMEEYYGYRLSGRAKVKLRKYIQRCRRQNLPILIEGRHASPPILRQVEPVGHSEGMGIGTGEQSFNAQNS